MLLVGACAASSMAFPPFMPRNVRRLVYTGAYLRQLNPVVVQSVPVSCSNIVKFVVIRAVLLNTQIFWDVTFLPTLRSIPEALNLLS
jgi:hypothetical protein